LTLTAFITWGATRNLPDGKLHVTFLEVGQGDAILITTPQGRQILIDGGPSPAWLGLRLGQEMPFWDRSLDVLINTHPDLDHLGGLVDLPTRYQIDTVLVSDVVSKSSHYAAWLNKLNISQEQPQTVWQGTKLQFDQGVEALILNPGPASSHLEAPNNHSVVVKVQMGQVSFLLTGDIEAEVEKALAHSPFDLRATVLKSAHHGSKTSSEAQFLTAVDPQIVVIQVGQDNRFGHPHDEVIQRYQERGLTILRTDQLGTIEFITDGEQVWLETRP
jgi:competence protein ComEC